MRNGSNDAYFSHPCGNKGVLSDAMLIIFRTFECGSNHREYTKSFNEYYSVIKNQECFRFCTNLNQMLSYLTFAVDECGKIMEKISSDFRFRRYSCSKYVNAIYHR